MIPSFGEWLLLLLLFSYPSLNTEFEPTYCYKFDSSWIYFDWRILRKVFYLTFNYGVCTYQLTSYIADKCISFGALGRQGTLFGSVCSFPWCKYSHHGLCIIQNIGKTCSQSDPTGVSSNTSLLLTKLPASHKIKLIKLQILKKNSLKAAVAYRKNIRHQNNCIIIFIEFKLTSIKIILDRPRKQFILSETKYHSSFKYTYFPLSFLISSSCF